MKGKKFLVLWVYPEFCRLLLEAYFAPPQCICLKNRVLSVNDRTNRMNRIWEFDFFKSILAEFSTF